MRRSPPPFIAAMLAGFVLLAGCGGSAHAAPVPSAALQAAVHNPLRTPKLVARDPARHPAAELAFFGLRPTDTVVEIDPGAGYWTEILAPFLRQRGTYYLALPVGGGAGAGAAQLRAKLAADPARFSAIHYTQIGAGADAVAPPDSADAVLTFRNLHNWMDAGYAPAAVAAFYTALKPGGVLGMEEHRGSNAVPQDPKAASGYVRQDYAIALVEKAGFKLVASSELLANPKDTKDYPAGVWTLPPTFTLGAKDHAKYAAIGEADNFLLLFRKPGP